MYHFTLVTGSPEKAKEYRMMLPGIEIDAVSADVDEIQSLDLEEIARKKVRAVYAVLNTPVVVDDTGFYLEHWGRLPGPLIKYFEKNYPRTALIRLLESAQNRRGYAKTCVAYFDGQKEIVASGEVHGTITDAPRGPEGAFGFDYEFIPDGYDKTLAELGFDIKNKISHRARALQEFKKKIGA